MLSNRFWGVDFKVSKLVLGIFSASLKICKIIGADWILIYYYLFCFIIVALIIVHSTLYLIVI